MLKELVADREFKLGRIVTITEISEATGIHRVTLYKMSNERGYNAGMDNGDRLCAFFDCQPGDLLVFIKDSPGRKAAPRAKKK